MHNPPLRILITCRDLTVRAGSQLYTRDLAEELRRLGHSPVVFSPRLGDVATEMRSRGAAVIDDLDRLGGPPSVIHGQHHLEAMAAMARFPSVPALYVCHGWMPWQEAPPAFPSLRRYVAVDNLRRDRLVLEHGIPEDRVTMIHNFVDLDRFQSRPPLPPRPRRALVLSNQASADSFAPALERACAAEGIQLTVVGVAAGRPVPRPEEILPTYDLVFARGRAALEAMAVGAAVILCDIEGDGPLVTPDNFAALRDLNFGMGALRGAVEEGRLRAEIGRYDPEAASEVRDQVRREAGRAAAVGRLVGLYREILADAPLLQGEAHRQACVEAAARYLAWLGPYVSDVEAAPAGPSAVEAALRRELAETRKTLAALERSPFSRLRSRLLGFRPLVAAYQAIKRQG